MAYVRYLASAGKFLVVACAFALASPSTFAAEIEEIIVTARDALAMALRRARQEDTDA